MERSTATRVSHVVSSQILRTLHFINTFSSHTYFLEYSNCTGMRSLGRNLSVVLPVFIFQLSPAVRSTTLEIIP